MNKINKKISLVLFFLSLSFSFGQSALENTYSKLNTKQQNLTSTLDSLKKILVNKVNFISIEKSKEKKDNDRLTELLASTSSITNLIDATQFEIDQNSEETDNIKSDLFLLYSKQIDSLKLDEVNNKINSFEIIKLTEKRLLVSQKIDMLSFSPQNVINIRPTENDTEQKIYNEYLVEANQEVENKLSEINNLREEIENIIELNQETEEFLEDINFDNNFAVYSNPTSTESNLSFENSADFTSGAEKNNLATQTESFGDILFQFGLSSSLTSDIQIDSKSNNGTTSLRAFRNLIDLVEKQLNDYKIVINNKLRNTNSK